METTYVKVQISFLTIPSLNIWDILGWKSGSEFDVSPATEQSSCCFDVGDQSVLSGLHLPIVLIIQFILSLGCMCSSRFPFVQRDFSMTQITGSSFNCILPAPQRGCRTFICKDLLTIFFWHRKKIYKIYKNFFKLYFPNVLTLLGLSISAKCMFHLKSSKIQLHWTINPI